MQPLDYDLLSEHDTAGYLGEITPCQVNFSGRPINGAQSAFTLVGWVRLVQTNTSQTIFICPDQFQFFVDENGYVTGNFLNVTPTVQVKSAHKIQDTLWHFVTARFEITPSGNWLSVFLDGILTASMVNLSGSGTAQSSCFLGENDSSGSIEIASWEIWERALTDNDLEMPMWGAPGAASPDLEGLLVAFDFSSENITSSNPNIFFIPNARKTVRPCLYMSGGISEISPSTIFPIGNAGPWSIMTWVKTPILTGEEQFIPFLNSGINSAEITLAIVPGNPTTIQLSLKLPNQDSQDLFSISQDCTDWTHLALTYDNDVIRLYINGKLSQTSESISLEAYFTGAVIGLGTVTGNNPWCGSLQCMSFWDRVIQASEIETFSGWVDIHSEGLFAYFPFLTDTNDIVKYLEINFQGDGSIKDDEEFLPTSNIVFKKFNLVENFAVTGNRILRAEDYWNLAAQNNITIPELDKISGRFDYGGSKAFYESNYFNIPEPQKSRAIADFQKNLRLGKELCERGIKTGRITSENKGRNTFFYYHTETGPQEIYRSEAILSPQEAYVVQIILDSVVILLMLLGLYVSPQGISSIMSRYNWVQRIQSSIGIALNNLPATETGALDALRIVVEAFISAGGIVDFVWSVVWASDTPWYSILFTVINVVITIVSAFIPALSAGYYAVRLAMIATQVAVLIVDINNKPTEQQQGVL